jgi:rod shape-determining protein MreB
MAAAIGSGLPIHEPIGNMIIDIGGGTSETAMVSMGGIVSLKAIRVGSFDFDSALQMYVRRVHGIAIGERTAEEIKVQIGSAWAGGDEFDAEVKGRDLTTGLPRTFILTPDQVRSAFEEPIQAVVDSVIDCLSLAPPELSQDVLLHGVHLVGGGSLLRGLDKRIEHAARVPVRVARTPMEAVVLGAGRVLDNFETLSSTFNTHGPRW